MHARHDAPLARAQAEREAARAHAEHDAALARAREAALAEARAQHQAARLQARSVRDAARLRGDEQRESETADRIEAMAQDRHADELRIAALTATLAATVPAMEVLHAAPLGTILGLPGSPVANAAGAASVNGVAVVVARELAELRARRTDADRLAASLRDERQRLAAEHDRQVAAAGRIETQIDAARRDQQSASAAGAQAARDAADSAAHAQSLEGAIAALAAAQHQAELAARAPSHHPARDRTVQEAAAAIAPAGAGLGHGAVIPVAGPIVRRFGAATDAGPAAGISIAPPPASLVSSPCRGTVLFAAPFRSYGQMAIVDCGQSWRFVLAGLARVDAAPGAHVRAGEPIGRMPEFTPGDGGRPTLYLQLRHGAATVDPRTYLR